MQLPCYFFLPSSKPSRNIGKFGAKKYFIDHQTENTIQLVFAIKDNFSGAICKSQDGESGNGMRGMMGMSEILMEMWGIKVVTQGIKVGMRGIRLGTWGIRVGTWGIKVGMQ